MEEEPHVHVVMERIGGEPNIQSYHRDGRCRQIEHQLTDPHAALFRAAMQYPDRVSELLSGAFEPERDGPVLLRFRCTEEPRIFLDEDGARHLIPPCRTCAHHELSEEELAEEEEDQEWEWK